MTTGLRQCRANRRVCTVKRLKGLLLCGIEHVDSDFIARSAPSLFGNGVYLLFGKGCYLVIDVFV